MEIVLFSSVIHILVYSLMCGNGLKISCLCAADINFPVIDLNKEKVIPVEVVAASLLCCPLAYVEAVMNRREVLSRVSEKACLIGEFP